MSTTHKSRDEVDIVQKRVCQVGDMLCKSPTTHVALLRQLNSVQASTRDLPSEILSLIFEYACPPVLAFCPNSRDYHYNGATSAHLFPVLTLGHVSSRWRQVAWSASRLWVNICLYVTKKNVRSVACILQLHLQNIGGLLLNLRLSASIHRRRQPISQKAIRPIKAILFHDEYSKKIQVLDLDAFGTAFLPIKPEDLLRLQCLRFMGTYRNKEKLLLEAFPDLRRVDLVNLAVDVELPWMSITHLFLNLVSIDVCTKLLTQCPNLVDFASESPLAVKEGRPVPQFPHVVTLNHLQRFSWAFTNDSWYLAMFQHIRLPALRYLHCDYRQCSDVKRFAMAFFSNTHSPVILRLGNLVNWELSIFRYIFNRTSSVRELKLDPCDGTSIDEAFRALALGGDNNTTECLPSLMSLEVDVFRDIRGYALGAIGVCLPFLILDVCKRRYNQSGSGLRIHIKKAQAYWHHSIKAEVALMVRDGFEFELVDEGGKTTWEAK